MEAGGGDLHHWKPFHAIKNHPQTFSPGAEQWCGVDVSVLEFHLQQWVAGTFIGHFFYLFSLSFAQYSWSFFSVCFSPTSLHLCPPSAASCCSLWSPLFHLSSLLWFPPFHFRSFLFSLAQPILPKGKRICFSPCLRFPPSPTAVPSLPRSYRPLSCSQHHPLPSLVPQHVQPLSSITGGQQERKHKMNQEGDITVKNNCACEMPSIVSPALVWTAFIWLDELHPPAQALTEFSMFSATKSVITWEMLACRSAPAWELWALQRGGGGLAMYTSFLRSFFPPCTLPAKHQASVAADLCALAHVITCFLVVLSQK